MSTRNVRLGLIALTILLLVLLCSSAVAEEVTTVASGKCGTNLTWKLDSEGKLTISGSGAMKDYSNIIHSDDAWRYSYQNDIKTVVIGDKVTSIGDYAFSFCENLTSVSIPESIKSIGNEAFRECQSLSAVYAGTLKSWLSITMEGFESNPMEYADNLYLNEEVPADLVIPDGITSIESYAFKGFSHLTSVTLPDGITEISSDAFLGCSNLTIYCEVGTSTATALRYSKSFVDLDYPDYELSQYNRSDGTSYISIQGYRGTDTEIVIPSVIESVPVTSIGGRAFEDCSNLTKVTLPESITSIGYYAFEDCSSLTTINIPSGITTIETRTFYGCTSLKSITIPDSLTKIEESAFHNCTLTNIYTESVEGWLNISMGNYYGAPYLYAKNLYFNGELATNVVIPDGVTSIRDRAFYGCTSLTSISLPDSVTSIGYDAFKQCSNFKDVYAASLEGWLGVSTDSIPYNGNLYINGKLVTSVIIPDNVTSIRAYAFEGCSNLTEVIIPDSVTDICSSAFRDCSNLVTVTLPDSVTNIESYAFMYCINLRSITLPEGLTSIGYDAFSGCTSLTNINIPNSITLFGSGAFIGCHKLRNITIPDGITSISGSAFNSCYNLQNIIIPDSVTSIGYLSFRDCGNINVFILGKDLPEVNANAFLSCTPTIYCYEFSEVDFWAAEKGYKTVYIDGRDLNDPWILELPADQNLAVGESIPITASFFPEKKGATVGWTSSAPDVVSVQNGVLTALSIGEATITATYGELSNSMLVTAYAELESFDLNATELWVVSKESVSDLYATNISPQGATYSLTWESSDTTVVDFDSNGQPVAKAPGDAIVTVTSDNGISRSCTIHVCYPVTAIAFETAELEITNGTTTQLKANVSARDQSFINKLVSFESSAPSVVSVNANGVVRAHAIGTATITVSASSGVTANCTITVRKANTLILPSSIIVIDEEAFKNTDAEIIVISNACTTIGARAFADNTGLVSIYMPDSVTEISADAFEGSENVSFICESENAAAEYAAEHEIEYLIG